MNYFFGDKKTAYKKQQFYGLSQELLLLQKPFSALKIKIFLNAIITTKQLHGADGLIISSEQQACDYAPYSKQADFIITNVPQIGIAVATADCLPIIAYDPIKKVIGIAHAGWQGTVKGIAVNMIKEMHQKFECNYTDIQIIFGPCASVNAYKITSNFTENVPLFKEQTIQKRLDAYYFDLVLYNRLLLEQHDIHHFDYSEHACTISNDRFCSHRREPESELRQLSVAVLH